MNNYANKFENLDELDTSQENKLTPKRNLHVSIVLLKRTWIRYLKTKPEKWENQLSMGYPHSDFF